MTPLVKPLGGLVREAQYVAPQPTFEVDAHTT